MVRDATLGRLSGPGVQCEWKEGRKTGDLGYFCKSEFVREAVRIRLREIDKDDEEDK